MSELTTEAALTILINWLQGNIDCESEMTFDKDEDHTDLAALLPGIGLAPRDVCVLYQLRNPERVM